MFFSPTHTSALCHVEIVSRDVGMARSRIVWLTASLECGVALEAAFRLACCIKHTEMIAGRNETFLRVEIVLIAAAASVVELSTSMTEAIVIPVLLFDVKMKKS